MTIVIQSSDYLFFSKSAAGKWREGGNQQKNPQHPKNPQPQKKPKTQTLIFFLIYPLISSSSVHPVEERFETK